MCDLCPSYRSSTGFFSFLYIYTPLNPHFYIVKLRFTGLYLFFLFLLQNIDCGYSLEPPHRGVPTIYVLGENKETIKKISDENFHFLEFLKSLYYMDMFS